MTREKGKKFLRLFLSTLQLSAFTFGGGFVIVPLMKKKFVEQLHWIDESEMMDLVAIAQSSPGAIAVNASILVGYHAAGFAGACVSVLGTILPPFVILSVISFFYQAFRDNLYVSMAMAGMFAGVAAVIWDVVVQMGKTILKLKRVLFILIMPGAFLAVFVFSVNIVYVILICGLIGAIDAVYRTKAAGKEKNQ